MKAQLGTLLADFAFTYFACLFVCLLSSLLALLCFALLARFALRAWLIYFVSLFWFLVLLCLVYLLYFALLAMLHFSYLICFTLQ